MSGLTQTDIKRMRDQLFLEGPGQTPPPASPCFRHDLNAAGLNGLDVRVSLVPASYQLVPR